MRRSSRHLRLLCPWRVPVADGMPDRGVPDPPLPGDLLDTIERQAEVFVDVVCKRPERRYVEAVDTVFKPPVPCADHEVVDDREERREGLPRPGRGADEDVLPLVDERDRHPLRRREPPLQLSSAPLPHVLVEETGDLRVRTPFLPCHLPSPAVIPRAPPCALPHGDAGGGRPALSLIRSGWRGIYRHRRSGGA